MNINESVFTTPHPGGLHLINEVKESLYRSGLNIETDSIYLPHEDIVFGMNLCLEAQRFLLNRFWNLQLMQLGNAQRVINPNFNTMDERFCLIDSGEFPVWLSLFNKKILPLAIEYRLPAALTKY